LESGRGTDRKKLNKLESEFREQLNERNTLLLSLWNKLSTLCGPDWTHQNSLVSGHLPTVDVVSNMLPGFSKNLLYAVKTLESHVSGFRNRVKQLDRDLAKDYRQIEEQLHVRLKRLDRLESAVQVSKVSSAASAAPEIARLRGENKLLRTEIDSLRKQDRVRAARASAVSIEPHPNNKDNSPRPPSRKSSAKRSSSSTVPNTDGASSRAPSVAAGHMGDLGPLPGEAEAAAMTAMVQNEPGQARWIHRLRELERRLKAEREARLLDRSGARKRLEEGRQENAQLKAELERERERRQAGESEA
jgi:Micro-tubular organiser Mto1 C-term Mto2-binding region